MDEADVPSADGRPEGVLDVDFFLELRDCEGGECRGGEGEVGRRVGKRGFEADLDLIRGVGLFLHD